MRASKGFSSMQSPAALNSTSNLDIGEEFFHHEITAPLRQEEVKLFVKQLGRKTTEERIFDRA